MNVEVSKSFEKDILKIEDKKTATLLSKIIDKLEDCQSLSEISSLKKMEGKGNFYRIRVGSYRIGLKLEQDTIFLLRCLDRKDIYKYFP